MLALLELLQRGGLRTVGELADLLGVDERTVRRYVEHLTELGLPVEAVRGRYGGYRLGAAWRLAPLVLTDDEAVATMLALATAEQGGGHGGPLAVATAAAKLRRSLPASLVARVDPLLAAARFTAVAERRTGSRPPSTDVLLTVARAVDERRPLTVQYTSSTGAESTRTVLPWGIVSHAGRWYVTGPDSLSGDQRTLRIDRIRSTTIVKGGFEVPAGFDPVKQVLTALALAPWAHEVDLRVQGEEALLRTELPSGLALLRRLPGPEEPPWFRARLHVEHLDHLARALAALDVPFVVERPEALRDELDALAARLARRAAH